MSSEQLVGTIVASFNGIEFDCTLAAPKNAAGCKLVPTMNSQGRARKWTKTTKSTTLSLEVVIPEEGDIDWNDVEDGVVTIESLSGKTRTSYLGCGCTEYSETYTVDGEAKRQVELFVLDVVKE